MTQVCHFKCNFLMSNFSCIFQLSLSTKNSASLLPTCAILNTISVCTSKYAIWIQFPRVTFSMQYFSSGFQLSISALLAWSRIFLFNYELNIGWIRFKVYPYFLNFGRFKNNVFFFILAHYFDRRKILRVIPQLHLCVIFTSGIF